LLKVRLSTTRGVISSAWAENRAGTRVAAHDHGCRRTGLAGLVRM
jgi:hypothetical protein